jgi:hypothetical protein
MSKHRDFTAGIGALCGAAVFIIMLFHARCTWNGVPVLPIFLGSLYSIIPHMFVMMALCWPGSSNKWLGLIALITMWGAVGVIYAID